VRNYYTKYNCVMKKYWPIALLFLLFLGLYRFIFNLYFTQDDFFHLKMSLASNFSDFINFFSFENHFGYHFYRPISTQVYNFVVVSLFGYNPFFFHLVSFFFFIANCFLVFKIMNKIIQKETFAWLAAFLYGVNASNVGSLSYIANFQEISMAFFAFLTFWFYINKNRIFILIFIFALLSKETSLVLPFIIIAYELLLGDKKWQRVLPLFLILGIYGILKISAGLPKVSVYQPIFSLKKILNSFFWYFLWGLGLPEMLIDFVGPGLKFNPELFIRFGKEMLVYFVGVFAFLGLFIFGLLKLPKIDRKTIIFFFLWFFVGLIPVIFWPLHKYVYYLTLPLLGLSAAMTIVLKSFSKPLCYLGIFLLTVLSVVTINLYQKTYWVINRAKMSQKIIEEFQKDYPILPKGAVVYFVNDPVYQRIPGFGNSSTQAYYALSGENAIQLLYHDLSARVYYEDIQKPQENTEKLIKIVAKIQ